MQDNENSYATLREMNSSRKITVIKEMPNSDVHNFLRNLMEEQDRILATDIHIEIDQLKIIIIELWQSGELYKLYYNSGNRGENLHRLILIEIAEFAEVMIKNVRKCTK